MTPQQELELQIFLASRLPEKIAFQQEHRMCPVSGASNPTGIFQFWWIDGHEIRDTEWFTVCRMVEETLNKTQWINYEAALWNVVRVQLATPELQIYQFGHASWQQRAQALKEILK